MGCCGRSSFNRRQKFNNSLNGKRTIFCKTCKKELYYRNGDKLVYCTTCKKFIELR
jgi:ribosomal protein L37AE/L43A